MCVCKKSYCSGEGELITLLADLAKEILSWTQMKMFWKATFGAGFLHSFFFFFSSLQEAFAQLDLDGDGRLSRKEVETALGNILSETDLDLLLLDLDTDQNGEVEWNEFLQVMKARMREPESVKMLKEAFRYVSSAMRGSVERSMPGRTHTVRKPTVTFRV